MSDDVANFCTEFVNVLLEFHSIWDGHLGQAGTTWKKMKYSPEDTPPAKATPYQAKRKAREVEKKEIAKVLHPDEVI